MATRHFRFAIFVLLCGSLVPQLRADCVSEFFHHVVQETKRRQCWPKPFVCPDRQAVRTPFAIMVQNGWRRQNMLGDHHFDPKTGALTEAGQLKVRWIVTEAPEMHKAVYVHQAFNPAETAARLSNVEAFIAQVAPQTPVPVIGTTIPDAGWPANQVDAIDRQFQQSMPAPRLPEVEADLGGS